MARALLWSGDMLQLDLDRLRELLRRLAITLPLAAAPALLPGCSCGDREMTYLVREPDETTAALIARCEDPAQHDCLPLCEHLRLVNSNPITRSDGAITHCALHREPDGYVRVDVRWDEICHGGRRPEGLRLAAVDAAGPGELFAQLAQLEAASVPAFARLERELRAHGAPSALVVEARRARADERRHARAVAALARRFGATPVEPEVPGELAARSLEALAAENAAEGCVREAYGALVAAHQARRAADPLVRRAMAAIAADELRHAALALAVDRWSAGKMPAAARRRVVELRHGAAAALATDVSRPVPRVVARIAGLPAPEAARRLAQATGSLAEAA